MNTRTLGHYIGGQWIGADGTLESLQPVEHRRGGRPLPRRRRRTRSPRRSPRPRTRSRAGRAPRPKCAPTCCDKAGEALFARSAEIGELLAREEGKTRAEGIGETLRAARIFRYFAGEALRRHGQTLESTRPGLDVATYREAIGVVGLITPWNFPIAIPAWKTAPALAFGNTVVLKPANITSAVAAALTEILDQAGIPPGVFNLVLGRGGVGRALVEHPDVAAISFTGSQGVGAQVAQGAVSRGARVQMEMGGKNPLVILADADLDKAVAIAADGGFFQTGQRCTASSRVIVEDAIHDRFVAALAERAASLKVGAALAEGTQVGPASSEAQFEQNFRYVGIATDEGGRLAAGGDKAACDTPGFFMQPTVIADTAPEMRINCEEVFGPVVSTIRAKDYEAGAGDRQHGRFRAQRGDRLEQCPADPRFPQARARRDGDGQPADRGGRLPRAVRRHPRDRATARANRASRRSNSTPRSKQSTREIRALAEGIMQPVAQGALYPSLAGKRVIVSGGGTGIGEGIVEAFVRQGAAVAFVDIQDAASEALVARLADAPIAPLFVHCDITDCADYGAKIAKIIDKLGGCDVLVNNAANDDRHKVEEVTPAYWDERMAVNLKHQFFAAKAVMPAMKAAGGGQHRQSRLDQLAPRPARPDAVPDRQGGDRGADPQPGARAGAADDIRVNAIIPGNVQTPRQMKWYTPEGEAEIVAAQCLEGRIQPADIAAMALFLACDDARFCTAHNYWVDAGWR